MVKNIRTLYIEVMLLDMDLVATPIWNHVRGITFMMTITD